MMVAKYANQMLLRTVLIIVDVPGKNTFTFLLVKAFQFFMIGANYIKIHLKSFIYIKPNRRHGKQNNPSGKQDNPTT